LGEHYHKGKGETEGRTIPSTKKKVRQGKKEKNHHILGEKNLRGGHGFQLTVKKAKVFGGIKPGVNNRI